MAPSRAGALPRDLALLIVGILMGQHSTSFAPLVSAQGTPASSLDFGPLGSVALAGSFAGLQVWDANYAADVRVTSGGTAASLWTRHANGTFAAVGATNTGGSITALCQSSQSSKVYIGGSFESFGGVTASNIASYDPTSNTFADLAGGLDGAVSSVACDDPSGTLYVGGAFRAPKSGGQGYGGHVASYSYAGASWAPLPFGGLSGDVNAIEPITTAYGRSVLFGGTFDLTLANASNTPSSSNFSAIPSLASALTPISLSSAYVWSGPNTDVADYSLANNVFCPNGADGSPNSTYLAADNNAAIIVVRLYRPLQVRALRLGNTFFQGRGTRQFKVVSVPDSIVQTFSYASDPSDPTSALTTCDWECPLTNNASVPYQDFLFQSDRLISGFQIDLDEHYGSSAGLHLLQLLSDGSYAFAVNDFNAANATCMSGIGQVNGNSMSTASGSWTTTYVASGLADTQAEILQATVPVGTSQANSPSVTFSPYVAWEGDYNVTMLIPGCGQMGDCAARTSVDISIASGAGAQTTIATVSQTNTNDVEPVIYSGRLSQGATFTLRLAASPVGTGSNGNYHLVANKINLVANSTDGIVAGARRPAHGLYEYVLPGTAGAFGDGVANASTINATSMAVPNATHFDSLALGLTSGSAVNTIVTSSSLNATFIGGSFSYSQNGTSLHSVLAFPANVSVPQGGLAGTVAALLEYGGYLYAGGAFNTTADKSGQGFGGVARWQYSQNGSSWQALDSGNAPDFGSGGVLALDTMSTDGTTYLVVVGGSSIAAFDPSTSAWDLTATGFFAGEIEALASPYFAGTVRATLEYAATGAAQLTESNGSPTLQPYNFPLSPGGTSSASSAATVANSSIVVNVRRHDHRFSNHSVVKRLAAPSATSLPSISATSAVTGAILAGAWWQNGTTSTALLGGNFTSGSVQNVGTVMDGALQPLPSLGALNGAVQALAVTSSETLFIGGNFTTSNNTQGLVFYDLKAQIPSSTQPLLQPYDGTNVAVNAIAHRPSNSSTIVAGFFEAVGSLPCVSICQYNADSGNWTPLGAGLSGTVGSLDFAGAGATQLYAAGEFQFNGSLAYAAVWDFDAQSWTGLSGGLSVPGPATAVSVDDGNSQNVFLAGTSSLNGTSAPYIIRWNGSAWSDVNEGAIISGIVQSLALVPLASSSKHEAEAVIESDRVLLASGNFTLNNIGIVSSAIFDGSSWSPFLVSATSTGAAGAIAAFFTSSVTFHPSKHHLSVAAIVLISMAIALGIVCMLVLACLLVALRSRRSAQGQPQPAVSLPLSEQDEKATQRHRPTSLLATLNAATALIATEKDHKRLGSESPEFDDSASIDDDDLPKDGTVASGVGLAIETEPDADERTWTRYSFVGENAGELSVGADQELRVLDRSDENWWLVADASGNRGLVPASYLL